jgi:hypothetical protein
MTDSAIPPLELPDAPYPGAEPFRLIDHPIFFERKHETRLLLQEIIVYRGVLLYGDSGAGKSSLINAGLIPTVRNEGFVPDRIRLKNLRDGEIIIERISLREDGKPPFLTPSLAGESGETDRVVLSINDFRTRLFDFAKEHYPLLIFDQFEEFATLFEQTQKPEESREAQRNQAEILKLLVELLRHRELKVKMLFSFREDYFAKLTQLFALSPELQQQYIRLIPPTTEKLREIIAGPFRNNELRAHFVSRSPSKAVFSDKLIDALEKDFRGRSTAGILNLTEVQLACQELWSSPTPEELYSKENVSGLLRLVLEDAVAKLAEQNLREPGVALLSFMVTSFGTRNVISEFDLLGQVRSAGDFEDEALKRALNLLVTDSKLVRKVVLREAPHYEIVSEFFAPWIAERRREREKIKAEREQQVSEKALRLRRITSIAAVAGAMAFLILTVGSLLIQYRRGQLAEVSSQLLELQKRQAQVNEKTKQLEEQSTELDRQRMIAEQKTLAVQKQLFQAERQADLRVSEANRRRLQQLQKDLDDLQDENQKLQKSIDERDEQIKTLTDRLSIANTNASVPQGTPTPVIIRTRPSAAADKPVRRSNMLFGSTMLEIALALILIYVLIGVVCAGVIGLIEAFTRQRSRFAWYGLMTLFDGDQDIGRQLASHPLVRPLGARPGRWPTGIPARSFALALIDIVAPSYVGQPKPLVYFYEKIAAIPNEYLRRALFTLSSEAQTTSDMLTEVGNLYDSTMERVVTAYRWRVYLRILVAAFLLSLALNADTINIANSIPRYVDLRATVLSDSVSLEPQPEPTFSSTPMPRVSPTPYSGSVPFGANASTQAAPTATPVSTETLVDSRSLKDVRKELNTLYLPIGWSRNPEDPRGLPSTSSAWIFKILGILITTLVASIIVQGLLLVWGSMQNRSRSTGTRNPASVL